MPLGGYAQPHEERAAAGVDVPVPPARPLGVEVAAARELADVRGELRPVPDRGIPGEKVGGHDRDAGADPDRSDAPGDRVKRLRRAPEPVARRPQAGWRPALVVFFSFSSFLRFFSSSFCRFWYPKLGFAKLCSPRLDVDAAKRTDRPPRNHGIAPAGPVRSW